MRQAAPAGQSASVLQPHWSQPAALPLTSIHWLTQACPSALPAQSAGLEQLHALWVSEMPGEHVGPSPRPAQSALPAHAQ